MSATEQRLSIFQRRLKQLRVYRHLSLERFGHRMGVSAVCAWKWETGRSFPRPANMTKLAEVLGTPLLSLCNDTEVQFETSRRKYISSGDQLKKVIALARHIVAEAANIPLASVTIIVNENVRNPVLKPSYRMDEARLCH